MSKGMVWVGVVACLAGGACVSGSPQSSPGNASNRIDERSATQPAAANKLDETSTVDDLLDALDQAGKDLRSLQATVLLTDVDNDTGSQTRRPGEVVLVREGNDVKFRATLKGVIVENDDGREGLRPEKIEYLLRGDELIDRNYKTRTESRHKLPPQEGKRDLLKLGEGPFPLPIGQSREDVYRLFDVREVDPDEEAQNEMGVDADENTRRLRLTPKPDTALAEDFQWLEIDVGLDDGMPRKVITLDPVGSTARVTELRKPKINAAVPDDAFELEPIDPNEWNIHYGELPD